MNELDSGNSAHIKQLKERLVSLVDRERDLVQRLEQANATLKDLTRREGIAHALLFRAEELVRALETGLGNITRSASMQLGYVLLSTTRSLRSFLRAPHNVFKILVRARRGEAPEVVKVPIPHEWFPADLRNELRDFHDGINRLDETFAKLENGNGKLVSRTERQGWKNLADVRICAIMDQFTYRAFSECCNVLQLTPDGYQDEVRGFRPDFLFIESAWHGKDSLWERHVSNATPVLANLVDHCRGLGVPVVFWSKEDPVHFKTFINTAAMADVVFTTDIDCIRHYKESLGHERVFLLPFAVQPKSHNPIESYARKEKFCFAGSYYLRYPTRQRDFDQLVTAAGKLSGVDIYDRNHGKDHPNYKFPAHYQSIILGGLPFEHIDIAYKGYEYGININTVKHSQTMFARRVFDLLASNTITISNYSRGLKLMFGDLVFASDSSAQIVSEMQPMLGDSSLRKKFKLAGLRKVMREHTYEHRLEYLLGKVFINPPARTAIRFSLVASVGDERQLATVVGMFEAFKYPEKLLYLVLKDGFVPEISPASQRIRVVTRAQAESVDVAATMAGSWVGRLAVSDYYGPDYLGDFSDAVCYADCNVIGKSAFFALDDSILALRGDGRQYRMQDSIQLRRGFAWAEALPVGALKDFSDLHDDACFTQVGLSICEYDYIQNGAVRSDLWPQASGNLDVDSGISMAELVGRAEHISAGGAPTHTASKLSSGLAGIEGLKIAELLGKPANRYVGVAVVDGACLIQSSLPAGQHAYAYIPSLFSREQAGLTDIARMQLVMEGNAAGFDLVLVYLDESKEKISHSILKSSVNITVTVPANTKWLKIGFRVSTAGEFAIRRLTFDHVPLSVDNLIMQGRFLVLVKNYPSYSDLYKHAFVHRRVKEYQACGICPDVFRIGDENLVYDEFDGVQVVRGQAEHLRSILESGQHEAVLVHFLDERMWDVLKDFVDRVRVYVWAHGAEIQSVSRRVFDIVDEKHAARAHKLSERRMRFWKSFFDNIHPNVRMVFVSNWFAKDVMDDVGVSLDAKSYRVVHNYIDTNLFRYERKPGDQRYKVLSIRPYESNKYANDLTVAAILRLSEREDFSKFEFRLVGDGRLFEETTAPLTKFKNVVIERRFLTQEEISVLHRDYGVFLCPTRMDAQGVSRDEAMSSGLVPVSTNVTAIPEFVDDSCGILTEPEDSEAIADALLRIAGDEKLFHTLSAGAAERVRRQSGYEATIQSEMDMFNVTHQCQRKAGGC